jgi:pimeloyl-ACP methyl ester carboxylesterase
MLKIYFSSGLAAICLSGCISKPSQVQARAVREEHVEFQNGDVTLAGTMFVPSGNGRHPAVLIYHGSGPEERNVLMGHWFAGQGVACLTYDKRGVGESTGDFRKIPFMDLVSDGLAGIDLLKSRRDINAKRIGVWGLSQGGWLGPLAASRSKDISFVIAVSGPGVSPGEQMVFYYANQLRDRGLPEDQIAAASELRRKVWRYLSTGSGYEVARQALERAQAQPWFEAIKNQGDRAFSASPPMSILDDEMTKSRDWFKVEMNYDPRIALRKLTVPALFLFGAADKLVPVQQSVDIIRQTLAESVHRDFKIFVFPGADHGLRVVRPDGGRMFAPGYLEAISEWLRVKVSSR